jgi:phosphate uptake regulator
MFKDLRSFWKGRHFLDEVYGEFREMLEGAERMFVMVCRALLQNTDVANLGQQIHEADRQINKLQKQMRRRIVEHLALQPTVDVSVCLILMSVIKDGERLGDYCKNLYEVVELLNEPLGREEYSKYFDEIDKDILALFGTTREAVFNADEEKARMAWDVENRIAKLCDRLVERIAKAPLSTNRAVCFALIARHFKRIVAHLVNIATSSILPLSDIDYFDERRLQE